MKIWKKDSGQVLVLTSLGMVVLLGFVGLATDVGVLFWQRHNLQIAADAAATAGALYESYGEAARTAAVAAAASNGVNDGVDGAVVNVNLPPASGPAAGQTGFVEVVTSRPSSTVFMALFGYNSITVSARAVAGSLPGVACIYLMNGSGTDLSLQGSGTIEGPGGAKTCGVYSNSTDPSSVAVNGNGNFVNTAFLSTMGGLSGAGNSNTSPTPVATGQPKQDVPISLDIAPPDPSTLSCTNLASLGLGTTKVSKTTYYVLTQAALNSIVSGKTFPICLSGNVMLQGASSAAPLVLPPGMYVFANQVAIGNYVQGTGITMDINGDGNPSSEEILTVTSSANSTYLSAPRSSMNYATAAARCSATGGACYDVLFLAPSTNAETFNLQWGSSGGSNKTCQPAATDTAGGQLVFNGIIDAPAANVILQDSGGYALVTGMVVGSLNLKTGLLCVDNYASSNPFSPLSHITLVE